MFIKITQGAEFKLLCYEGVCPSSQVLIPHWETIVHQNHKAGGSFDYDNHLIMLQEYGYMLSSYIKIKAMLWKCAFVMDIETINELRNAGYPINLASSQAYEESIYNGVNRVENMLTHLTMKENEIVFFMKEANKGKSKSVTYAQMVAPLIAAGMSIPDEISLSLYNSLKSILPKKAS